MGIAVLAVFGILLLVLGEMTAGVVLLFTALFSFGAMCSVYIVVKVILLAELLFLFHHWRERPLMALIACLLWVATMAVIAVGSYLVNGGAKVAWYFVGFVCFWIAVFMSGKFKRMLTIQPSEAFASPQPDVPEPD